MPLDQYRTVVAALDRLTTQVGRVADAMPTPVPTPVAADDDGPTTDDDARDPAYRAVFAYIRRQPRDFMPTTVVERNAIIWGAVHAALGAMPDSQAVRTCDASSSTGMTVVGPCALRYQHDGPMHQDRRGGTWTMTPTPATDRGGCCDCPHEMEA